MNPSGRLPLFPLGIVVYPDEPVPLHIFESRYREMVQLCMAEDRPFGIVYATEDEIAEVGCTARVRRVLNKYDDGRLDIVASGEVRFRLVQVFRDQPCLTADVATFGVDGSTEEVDTESRERVITLHIKLLEMAGEEIRTSIYENAPWVSFVVARNAGLEVEQKQELLEMTTEDERVAYLIEHFRTLFARVEQAQEMNRLAQGDGHANGFPEL